MRPKRSIFQLGLLARNFAWARRSFLIPLVGRFWLKASRNCPDSASCLQLIHLDFSSRLDSVLVKVRIYFERSLFSRTLRVAWDTDFFDCPSRLEFQQKKTQKPKCRKKFFLFFRIFGVQRVESVLRLAPRFQLHCYVLRVACPLQMLIFCVLRTPYLN